MGLPLLQNYEVHPAMRNPVLVMTTYKGPEAFTAACLANLCATWGSLSEEQAIPNGGNRRPSGPAQDPLQLVMARGTDPSAQLYRAVKDLKAAGAPASTSGILSLEHDHGFEPQDLHDLLQVAKSQPDAIVGGLYYQRSADVLVGQRVQPIPYWEDEPTPAYLCTAVGLGFTFIPWSAFEKIPEPWFDPGWLRTQGEAGWTRESHDQAFCREARNLEIPIVGVILRTLTHLHEVQPRGVVFKKERA